MRKVVGEDNVSLLDHFVRNLLLQVVFTLLQDWWTFGLRLVGSLQDAAYYSRRLQIASEG